jgi:hypothetical protein
MPDSVRLNRLREKLVAMGRRADPSRLKPLGMTKNEGLNDTAGT